MYVNSMLKELFWYLSGEEHIKNLRKDSRFYWVYAAISGVFKNGILIEYKSIRTPISFEEKVKYQLIYDEIKKQNNESTRRIIYSWA